MTNFRLPLFIAMIILICNACYRPISTTKAWVAFCKSEPDAESVYHKFMTIAPDNSIAIYQELEKELANNENSPEETCYAFLYIFSLLTFDIDTHYEKYTLGDISRYKEVAKRDDYMIAFANSGKCVKDISKEMKIFERLSGSKILKTDKHE